MDGGGRLAISSPLAPALTRSAGGELALMGWVNASRPSASFGHDDLRTIEGLIEAA